MICLDVPDTVVEIAGDPLAYEIAGLVCLYECLVGVHVWYVVEGVSVDCGRVQW